MLNGSPFQRFALRLRPLMILPAMLSAACRQPPPAEKAATPTPQTTVNRNPLEMPSPVMDKPYFGTGIIMLINRKEGWVEIKHEEIKGLMPAMTMEFWLKSRSFLNHVSVGDRVDFTIVETHKGEFITSLKKSPTVP